MDRSVARDDSDTNIGLGLIGCQAVNRERGTRCNHTIHDSLPDTPPLFTIHCLTPLGIRHSKLRDGTSHPLQDRRKACVIDGRYDADSECDRCTCCDETLELSAENTQTVETLQRERYPACGN